MTIEHTITLVGFPYNDVKDCLSEHFSQALGRTVTLRHEPDNAKDHNAVAVYDWLQRKGCYVCKNDRSIIHSLFKAKGRSRLRVRIDKACEEHAYMEVKVSHDEVFEIVDLDPVAGYYGWGCSVPKLPYHDVIKQLIHACETIDDLMGFTPRSTEDEEELRNAIRLLIQKSKFDISRDMCEYRQQLSKRLMAMNDEEMRDMGHVLKRMSGITGRELMEGGEVLEFWKQRLMNHEDSIITISKMMGKNIDDPDALNKKLDEIKTQLYAFQHDLYITWLYDRENFVAQLNYYSIPREELWHFISGIVIVEVMKDSRSREGIMKNWMRKLDLKSVPDETLAHIKATLEFFNHMADNIYESQVKMISQEQTRRTEIRYAQQQAANITVEAGAQYIHQIETQQNSGIDHIKLLEQ